MESIIKNPLDRLPKHNKNLYLKPLHKTGFIQWYEDFRNKMGAFVDAGKEVLAGEQFDYSPQLPREVYTHHYIDADGQPASYDEAWSNYAQNVLNHENEKREKKQAALELSRGLLWAQVVGCLEIAVSERIKTQNKVAFEAARVNFNCVELFRILRMACDAMAHDQVLDLRTRLSEITHGQNEQFDSFCLRLESLFDQLLAAGEIITEKHKTGHLIKAIDKKFFGSVITDALTNLITDPDYPEYDPLKRKMAAFWRNMRPEPAISGKKRKAAEEADDGEEFDQDAAGKAYSRRNRKVVKVNALQKEVNDLKAKLKLQDDSTAGGKGRDMKDVECYRCGKRGHFSNDRTQCKATNVKCGSCGSEAHRTEYCKTIAANREKRENAGGKVKGGKRQFKANVRTVTVTRGQLSITTVAPKPVVGDHLPANPVLGALSNARAVTPGKATTRTVHLKMLLAVKNPEDEKLSANTAATGTTVPAAPAAPTALSFTEGYGTAESEGESLSDAETSTKEAHTTVTAPVTAAQPQPVAVVAEVDPGQQSEPKIASSEEEPTESEGEQADEKSDEKHSDPDETAESLAKRLDADQARRREEDLEDRLEDWGLEGLEHFVMLINNTKIEREKLLVLLSKKLDKKTDQVRARDDRRRQCTRVADRFGLDMEPHNREDLIAVISAQLLELSDQGGRLIDLCTLLEITDEDDPNMAEIKETYLCAPKLPHYLIGSRDADRELEEERSRQEKIRLAKRAASAAKNKKGKKGGHTEEVKKPKASGAVDTEDEEDLEQRQDEEEQSEPEPEQRVTRKRRKEASPPTPKLRDETPSDSSEDNDLEKITHSSRKGAADPRTAVSGVKGDPPQKKGKGSQTSSGGNTTVAALQRFFGAEPAKAADLTALASRLDSAPPPGSARAADRHNKAKAPVSPTSNPESPKYSAAAAASSVAQGPKTTAGKPAAKPVPSAGSGAPPYARSDPMVDLTTSPDHIADPKSAPPRGATKAKNKTTATAKAAQDRRGAPGELAPSVLEQTRGQQSAAPPAPRQQSVPPPVQRQQPGAKSRASPPPPAATKFLNTVRPTVMELHEAGYMTKPVRLNDREYVFIALNMDGSNVNSDSWNEFVSCIPRRPADASTIPVALLNGPSLEGLIARGTKFTMVQHGSSSPDRAFVTMVHRRARERQVASRRRGRHVVVDSGAAVNVYRNRGALDSFQPTGEDIGMVAANGASMPIQDVGQVSGLGTVVLSKAANADILSVSQLCTENPGLVVSFDAHCVMLDHPALSEPITGPMTDGNLYSIDTEAVTALIRARLGHAPVYTTTRAAVGTTPETAVSTSTTEPTAVGQPTDETAVSSNRTAVQGGASTTANTGRYLNVELTPDEVRRATELRVLHNVLGHPSDDQLITSLSNGVIVGTHLTARDVDLANRHLGECLCCAAAKAVRPTYTTSLNETAVKIGERVYADLYPLQDDANIYGGYTVLIIAVDSFSNMLHVIACKTKSSKDLCTGLGKLIARYNEYGHVIGELHTDAETSINACSDWLSHQQIPLCVAEPGQHCQRIERQVRTVKERIMCLRSASPLVIPPEMDGELVRTAVYILNDLPNAKNAFQSPRMLFEGKRLDLSKRKQIPFGTVCILPFPDDKEQKVRLGVLLGPAPRTYNANNCWVFNTKRMVVRGRVRPLTAIPEDLPWKVKKGMENFTNFKYKKPRKSAKMKNIVAAAAAEKATAIRARTAVRDMEEEYDSGSESSLGGEMAVESDKETETLPLLPKIISRANAQPKLSVKESMAIAEAVRIQNAPAILQEAMKKRKLLDETNAELESRMKRAQLIIDTDTAERQAEIVQAMATERAAAATESIAPPTGNRTAVRDTPTSTKSAGVQAQQQRQLEKRLMSAVPEQQPSRASKRQAERNLRKAVGMLGTTAAKEFLELYKLSIKEGLEGEHPVESKEAVKSEIMNMLHYKVGHYIKFNDIPKDKRGNILQSFMFLKHKTTPNGLYEKTKARMVGNGATQKQHMYDLVSSSTVALSSVFLLCNLASYYRAKLTTYDIKGAFLHAEFGENDEVTYIRVNKEIATLWVELDPSAASFVDERGTLLLELDKFIYGLKQSPLKFQQHLTNVLTNLGYRQLSGDKCLYVKHEGENFSVLSTHVDDIMQVATLDKFYSELKQGLIDAYADITTSENGEAYLGMSIERSEKDSRFIKLSQRGLIDKVLEKYPKQPGDQQKYFSPAANDLFNVRAGDTGPLSAAGVSEFLSVLMTLMYLARLTRPDILMGVTYLASRTHCATNQDVNHLMRIIRYIEGTKDVGIHINCESLQLYCSCDASYAVHTPAKDTKGHTGYIVGFGENMSYLHGRSGKQKAASTSSSDAEIIALCEATKMCVWMRELIRELQIVGLSEIIIHQDNKSVIMMSTEDTLTKKSKHVLTKLTYVQSMVMSSAIKIQYLATGEMTSDVLSKPLHGAVYYKHVKQMMGLKWAHHFASSRSIHARWNQMRESV